VKTHSQFEVNNNNNKLCGNLLADCIALDDIDGDDCGMNKWQGKPMYWRRPLAPVALCPP
jgi:hypothetical protein